MVRRVASFALGLALFVALGFALAHARALKAPGTSEFSAPCESAPPAFKAAGEAKALSSLDWSFAADSADTPRYVAGRARADKFAAPLQPSAPATFPPLFRRPPPSAS